MAEKFEVSFNSPQCGWMSVGFKNGENEFNSTTAYTPHSQALTEILKGLTSLIDATTPRDEFIVHWSRNPEAFDFLFKRDGTSIEFTVIEYPTFNRLSTEAETVFSYQGNAEEFCRAFHQTFSQLYEDRNTDEFEQNWRQPFPFTEYKDLENMVKG
jgi:hypothetical protein